MKLRHFSLLVAAGSLGLTPLLRAQTYEQANASALIDVQKSEKELADLRRKIADEKIPLSQQLNKLESEIIQKRRDVQRVNVARDNRQVDLNSLRNEVKAREDENAYMGNLMGEYIRAFTTRVHPAEVQLYQDIANEALNARENPNLSASDKFQAQIAVIRTALARAKKNIGGEVFSGDALGRGNVVKQGRFALVGPIAMFASDDGEYAGSAELQLNAAYPVVIDLGAKYSADIKALTSTGTGEMPVDGSMGNALRLEKTKETLVEHIKKGGPVMVPILLLAGAAILVFIFKFFEIIAVRNPRQGVVQEVIGLVQNGEDEKALQVASTVSGSFGELLVSGVKHAREDKQVLEEVLYERLLAAQPKLERLLAFIALTAGSAPLLGLLGTVTGMIQTFRLITVFGTGDAKQLSSGISEALITTEFGLYIAVPALLGHALLSRLAKGKLSDMEEISVAFVNGVSTAQK